MATRSQILKAKLAALPNDPSYFNADGRVCAEAFSDFCGLEVSDAELAKFAKRPSVAVVADQPVPPAPAVKPAPIAPPQPEDAIGFAEREVRAAELALDAARGAVNAAQRDVKACRSRLAVALGAWQQGFVPRTPESVAREAIASAQAMKLAVAKGEIDPNAGRTDAPGPSHLDRITFGGRGDVNRSFGRGYARGAMPSSMRGRVLPSVR